MAKFYQKTYIAFRKYYAKELLILSRLWLVDVTAIFLELLHVKETNRFEGFGRAAQ